MNKFIAVVLGLGLATGAFAQDARFIEYEEIDECGDVIGGGEWRPKTKGDSRVLDAVEFSIDLATESIIDCKERQQCDGGGHDELLKGACYRLKSLLGGGRKFNFQLYSVVEMVCSGDTGGGGNNSCGGLPDNAASTRAILIHNGFTFHDTQGQEELNEQSP